MKFIFVLGCGDTAKVISSLGMLTSPNYPKDYPNNEYCYNVIRVPVGERIRLVIVYFNVDPTIWTTYDPW